MGNVVVNVTDLPDPLLVLDPLGVVQQCNRCDAPIFDRVPQDVLGQHVGELFSPRDATALRELASDGWLGLSERRFVTHTGRTVSLAVAQLSENPPRWVMTVRDLTASLIVGEAQTRQAQLVALAELADAIARELNDSISVVQGRLELLLELGVSDDPIALRRHLGVALDHARRVSASLRNLRHVGRGSSAELERVSIADTIEAAVEMAGPRASRVMLDVDIRPEDLTVGASEALLARVIGNLILHALDSCGPQADLSIHAFAQDEDVTIQIRAGRTLNEHTTPPGPRDASLGLSVADALISSMGGTMMRRASAGSIHLELTLPPPPLRRVRKRRNGERVLVVGGEDLATVLDRMIAPDGFDVESVASAEAALQRLEEGSRVDALATDLLLPGMSGLALIEVLRHQHPILARRVLLVTRTELSAEPDSVPVLRTPLRRMRVLDALGRKVKRRRTGSSTLPDEP